MSYSKSLKTNNRTNLRLRSGERQRHDILPILREVSQSQSVVQDGSGIASWVSNKIRNPVRKFVANTGIVANVQPLYPGEQHLPFHNFAGPGTHVKERLARGDKPTTRADAVAKVHDVDYMEIQDDYKAGKITKPQALSATRVADNKMLRSLNKIQSSNLLEKAGKYLSSQAIQGKKELENMNVISPGQFSIGEGKPTAKLEKLASKMIKAKSAPKKPKSAQAQVKRQEGGFWGALLAGLLPSVISAIAGK